MKPSVFLLASLSFLSRSVAVPIPVAGSMHYTQNFDGLSKTPSNDFSSTTWSDDTTLSGWYFYRAGNGAGSTIGFAGNNFQYRVTDGSLQAGQTNNLINTGWFYSMGGPPGAANGFDRSLGVVPITAQGELSYLAVFQNTGATSVRLTNIAFNAEIWRTNQSAYVIETIAVWWRKAPTQAELLTMTSAAATVAVWPATVATNPTSQYVTGWNRVANADFTYNSAVANTKTYESHPVSAVPVSEIEILPNEFFSIRWGSINDKDADALMGIDDLDLTFTGADTGVSAVTGNVVRTDAGTAHVATDDTVGFDLTVSATAAVSPSGWKITSPAALAGTTGAYGVPLNVPGVPIAEFKGTAHVLTLTVEDADSPAITAPAQVVSPWCQITPVTASGFSYDSKGTLTTADDQVTYNLGADGTFTGPVFHLNTPAVSAPYGSPSIVSVAAAPPGTFVTHIFTDDSDPSCTATLDVFPPAAIGTNAMTLTPVPMISLPVAPNGTVRWTVNAAAGTLTQENNLAQGDHVVLSEVMNVPAGPTVQFSATLVATTVLTGATSGFEAADSFALELSYDGQAFFSVLGAADADSSGRLTGTTELPGAAGVTRTYNFPTDIPATAGTVQVRITGNSNSSAEKFIVSNVRLAIPQPTITVSAASNIIRNSNNPGGADDTVSFDVTISGVNGGNGWTTTGATPASGAFGLITFTVPAGSKTAVIRITENTFPGAFADVTVTLPGPYIIGSYDTGAGSVPLFTTETPAPDAQWVLSGTPPILTMNGNGLLTPDKTVKSEEVILTGVAGALEAVANLHVHDLTTGFEVDDRFNAYAILDGNTGNRVPMIARWDLDGSGLMTGAEICPAPAVPNTIQDFDYALSAVIPAGTGKVQIVFTGLCNSANETMILSGISILPGAVDTDADGMSDGYEDANGLDKIRRADRDLDFDGDGQTNYLEFVAGTAANSAASMLHITADTVDQTTGAATVTWASVATKFYRLQYSADLTSWTDTGRVVTAAGASTSAEFTVPGAPITAGKAFLRVKVVP